MSRWDDEQGRYDALHRELRGLVGTGWGVPAGGAAAAVRTGRRRVVGKVAAVSALCAAMVTGVPAGLSLGSTTAAPVPPAVERPVPTGAPVTPTVPPVTSAPSVAPSAAPSVAPSVLPSAGVVPTSPVAVPPVEPPSPAPVSVTAGATGPSRAGELAGLDVPELVLGGGAPSDVLGGPASWPFDPCGRGSHEDDDLRTGWAALSTRATTTGTGGVHRAVASYPSEEVARQVVRSFAALGEQCWQEQTGVPSQLWRTQQASDTVVRGTFRSYAEPSAVEEELLRAQAQQGGIVPLVREGGYLVVVREGRHVGMAMAVLEGAASYVAGSEGDLRPGAGAHPGTTPEENRPEVDAKLALVQQDAAQMASAALEAGG